MEKRTLVLISRDPNESKRTETTLPFDVSTQATYQNIDTAMRQLNSLTNNVYVDTLSVNTVSVTNEINND